MGKAKKRPRDDAKEESAADESTDLLGAERARALEAMRAMPRLSLLILRRDLALLPFAELLRGVRESGQGEVAGAIDELGDAALVQLLPRALEIARLRCWTFQAQVVDAARTSVEELAAEKRQALLADLRQAGQVPFCPAIRRHLGRKAGEALMRVGRARAMWLLGAAADELETLECAGQLGGHKPQPTPEPADSDRHSFVDQAPMSLAQEATDVSNACVDELAEADVESGKAPAPKVAKTGKLDAKTKLKAKAKCRESGYKMDGSSSDSDRGDEKATLKFLRRLRRKKQSEGVPADAPA